MKKQITILALIFATIFANAQFVNITTADGLSCNNTTCFKKDLTGNLWIGTQDGLSKLSPIGIYTNYTISTGLIYNYVNDIEVDNYGKVWVASDFGISIYNGSVWTTHSFGSTNNNRIKDIEVRTNGDIWFATENVGIWVYNGFTYYKLTTVNGLPSDVITCLEEDINGVMWIGTENKGLCRYDEPGFTVFDTTNGIEGMRINTILATQDGIYFYSWGKLHFFDGNYFTISDYEEYQTGSGSCNKIIKGNNDDIFLQFTSNIVQINNYEIINIYTTYNSNLIINYPTIYSSLTNIYFYNDTLYVSTIDNGYYYSSNYENNVLFNDTLDINNIKALVNSTGVLFSTTYSPYSVFEVPINSGKKSNVLSTIWLGGIDDDNNFHIIGALGNKYRDWDVGPISNNYDEDYHNKYDRVWKIDKSEIDEHIANWNVTGYIMPEVIENWPAIAEYEDINSNGIYDPQNGDYPLIRGDQAILSIFNDGIRRNFIPNRKKMNIEVYCLVYAYNSLDSALNNTIFTSYKIKNKSTSNYKSVYMGVYDEIKIGRVSMYLGTDTILNSLFGYTSSNYDTLENGYGIGSIPAQSVTFLNTKMTSSTYFGYTDGTYSPPPEMIEPQDQAEYFNYLMGYWRDGTPITFGGNAYGGTTQTNYVFTGDPSVPSGWNENDVGNNPGHRKGLGIVGPLTLNIGQEICIDIAYVNAIAWNYTNLHSVKLLKSRIGNIHYWYSTQSFTCDSIITSSQNTVNIFAHDTTFCNVYSTSINLTTVRTGGVYPFTFQWEDETGTVFSTIETPSVSCPTTTSNYYVTITDNLGNTATDTLTITIVPIPTINLGNDTTICSGQSLDINLLGYNSYEWNTGSTSNSIHITETGTYVVTVYNNGCLAIGHKHIDVISPEINLTEITPACINETLQLTVDNYPTINWSTGETTATININTSSLGQAYYYVSVTDTNGCTNNDSTLVIVNDYPQIYLGNDTAIDEAWSLLLDAYVGPNGSYIWSDASTGSIYNFDGSIGEGVYNVSVQVSDINGCTNNDDINITVIAGLIIDETGNYKLVIYPNPTEDIINIKLPDNKTYKYKIVDIKGKIINQGIFNSTINKISLKDISKGVYFLKIDELNINERIILK